MIATLAEVKSILQIIDTSKDSVINALLPSVERFILDWTRNQFKQTKVRIQGKGISFDATTKAILDSAGGFVLRKFAPGIQIVVEGSLLNDGVYKINTVTATQLTLTPESVLKAESAGEYVTITMVSYPASLKLDVASMISFAMAKANKEGIQSESLGDYSVTFTDASTYPGVILSRLRPYRKVGW
ncbi:phage head-tail connector protein [Paenibacillus alkaliterrae]|uniref:phage head-tail connector protein n=1 Tax=Paenibacillus alkaliterrae TaxID=320909 RepID=UPI001F451B13|nr:phage head-tail connector protein [Paenibacillus alkaliterrae]MCF2939041.1 phage head-tail connector protein [Paenibacillus alkaliterrae]